MHEMGIALEIIDIVNASVPEGADPGSVRKVHLQVGKLSAIVADSLRFCFEVATRDTPLAGAQLVIEELPVVALCNECGHRWTVEEPVFICEKCDSGSLSIVSGRELDIRSIEITDEDQSHAV